MYPWLYKLASPKFFYHFSGRLLPWLTVITALLFIVGLVGALLVAPPDYQQGDAFRILYIHAPSAFLSLQIYGVMTFVAVLSLVWKIKLADIVANISAPLGAWFTFLTLATGSLWGKPMWGTWWIWDARLTSELILLFIYLGIIALRRAVPEPRAAAKAAHILTIVGVVNIPIIHYSVYWWNTLHQGATIGKLAKPSIELDMLWPLLVMVAAFTLFYGVMILWRARWEVVYKEAHTAWVSQLR